MINLLEWFSGFVSLLGSAAFVIIAAVLVSPYVARVLSAMLAAQADAMEYGRKTRQDAWRFYHEVIVLEKKRENREGEEN